MNKGSIILLLLNSSDAQYKKGKYTCIYRGSYKNLENCENQIKRGTFDV